MQLSQNAVGVFGASGMQSNRWLDNSIFSTSRISSVNRFSDNSTRSVDLARVQRVYLVRDGASAEQLRSGATRYVQNYRGALRHAESREDVNLLHLQQMGVLMDTAKRSGDVESTYIMRHLRLLNEERNKFMNSEDYESLSSRFTPEEKECPFAQEKDEDGNCAPAGSGPSVSSEPSSEVQRQPKIGSTDYFPAMSSAAASA